jgi:hypothetical protein
VGRSQSTSHFYQPIPLFYSMKFTARHISILLLLLLCGTEKWSYAQVDDLKNLPELSLPLTDKKLVIAHCMTNIIRYKGHPFEDGCNPEYYAVKDNPTAAIGGMTQVNVLNESLLKDASLDESVEFEMLAAKRAGIDGFQFYYTLNDHGSDEIIKAYFRVAKKKNIDFKFTFCISHPSGSDEVHKINTFARRMNAIIESAGRDDQHWLRTPDGRLIIYMWYGEQLADIPQEAKFSDAYFAARAFKRLAAAVNEKFACIYSINEDIHQDVLNSYLDYFPATWMWTLPYKKNYTGKFVAVTSKLRKRTFTGSAFNDFYTSKVLKPGTWDILTVNAAVKAGIGKLERKAIVTGLSANFRKMMEFNIDQDVPIINIITWNDYPEGHHFAPESNHNDGFSLLLKYYKQQWLRLPVNVMNEQGIVFYKKYAAEIRPSPFDIPVIYVEKGATKPSGEDGIEVVTILKDAAILFVNADSAMVPRGFNVTRFKQQSGPVHVSAKRGNQLVFDFTPPEMITNTPVRTDRLTYTYSNETEEYYKEIFGDKAPTKISFNNN